jgi:hypothetical protein
VSLASSESFARFVGQVWVGNEGRLDQEFLPVYFGGIIRIFRERIGGSW